MVIFALLEATLNESFEFAKKYLGRGWRILPYELKTKRPTYPNWQKIQPTLDDFTKPCNIGYRFTGLLVDVDLDTSEAVALADYFLPATSMEHGRPSRPRSHRWYNADGERKYTKFTSADQTLLEIRTSENGSHQTMIPPSVHPSGEQLSWHGEEPASVPFPSLLEACGVLAAACLLVRSFPPSRRNDLALALSGFLLRNGGWTEERAHHFVLTVFQHGGSQDPDGRARAVAATQAKLESGEAVTGIPTLVEILGRPVVDLLTKWLRISRYDSSEFVTTEYDLAELVAHDNPDLIYDEQVRVWFKWSGKVWKECSEFEIGRRVQTAQAAVRDAALKAMQSVEDEKLKKTLEVSLSLVNRTSNQKGLVALSNLAKASMVKEKPFDADHWLFNVENGTIDLHTGELLPHNREHLITKIAPVAYDDEARCPRWHTFLKQFLPDGEIRVLVQRLMGYAMTGVRREQVFPIFWGDGANGKSTFLDTICTIYGDYARTASARAFIGKRSETQPDIVALDGSRLVRASEPARTALDESLVKQMTGDQALSVRGLYEKTRTIYPTWKAVTLANYKPLVEGSDDGIWRRIVLVPWSVKIAREEQVQNYHLQLLEERAGILNWCLVGCFEWDEKGLEVPAAAKLSTDAYRADSDMLHDFVVECFEGVGIKDAWDYSDDVFLTYKAWESRRGTERQHMLTRPDFCERLAQKGFEKRQKKVKGKNRNVWFGGRRNEEARRLLANSEYTSGPTNLREEDDGEV